MTNARTKIDLVENFTDASKIRIVADIGMAKHIIDEIENMTPPDRVKVLSSPNVVFELCMGDQGEGVMDLLLGFCTEERAAIFVAKSASLALASRYPDKTWEYMNEFLEEQLFDALQKGGPAVMNLVAPGPNVVRGFGYGHDLLEKIATWAPERQVALLSRNNNYTAFSWTGELRQKRDQLMSDLKAKGLWTLDGKPAPQPVYFLS